MKTKNLVILAFAILASTGGAFADSGAGRNGPDQSGVSIPAKMDRALGFVDFRDAANYCTVNVYAKSLLRQILRQDIRRPLPYKTLTNYKIVFDNNTNSYNKIYEHYLETIIKINDLYFGLNTSNWITEPTIEKPNQDRTTEFNFYLSSKEDFDKSNDRIENALSFIVPIELFNSILAAAKSRARFLGGIEIYLDTQKETLYDDLGTPNEVTQILIKSYIVRSSNEIIRMLNLYPSLNPRVNLTVSAEEFNQCVQNQLK